jgi:hypothetical protein
MGKLLAAVLLVAIAGCAGDEDCGDKACVPPQSLTDHGNMCVEWPSCMDVYPSEELTSRGLNIIEGWRVSQVCGLAPPLYIPGQAPGDTRYKRMCSDCAFEDTGEAVTGCYIEFLSEDARLGDANGNYVAQPARLYCAPSGKDCN